MIVALDLDRERKRNTKPDVKTQSKKKLVTISVMKNLKDNLLKEINSVQKAPKNCAEKNGPKSSNTPEESVTKNRRERSKSTNEDVSTRDQPENSEEHQPLSNPGNKYLQEAIKYLTEHGYRPNEQSEENGTRTEVMHSWKLDGDQRKKLASVMTNIVNIE